MFKLPFYVFGFLPGCLLSVAEPNERAGLFPASSSHQYSPGSMCVFCIFLYCMFHIWFAKRTVLSSSGQTMKCSECMLDTGCLQFVLFTVRKSTRAILLVVYCINGYWPVILFVGE